MKIKLSGIVMMTVFLVLMGSGLVFSQEAAVTPEASPEAQDEPETQWIWGEVVSVDPQKNEVMVKYVDYETDQEKQLAVSVNEKTTYENAKSLSEIKPQDTVGVDYSVNAEARNIALNISLEKPEAQVGPKPESNEAVPASPQPTGD